MFKTLLMSVVFMPVLLGMLAATFGGRRRGLLQLLTLVLVYDVLYVLMLYFLRYRWVG
jgi:hypothetical protein